VFSLKILLFCCILYVNIITLVNKSARSDSDDVKIECKLCHLEIIHAVQKPENKREKGEDVIVINFQFYTCMQRVGLDSMLVTEDHHIPDFIGT
jgi:hypothetical protein